MYLWYSKRTSVTGKALAEKLGLTRISPTHPKREFGSLPPPKGTKICINYGSTDVRTPLRGIKFLNHPENLVKYTDKLKALKCMFDSEVSVPFFQENKDALNKAFALQPNLRLIGRTCRHQGGGGFRLIRSKSDLVRDNQSDYWLLQVGMTPESREYRVHVFNGEVIKIQRKTPHLDEDENEITPTSYDCKSHDNGWMFSKCDIDRVHASVREQALLAVSSLGYDFGAIDIIREPETNLTYVLEVNSGMGLDEAGLELYKDKFEDFLQENDLEIA
jgi:glutathione synthase/RimK-type ligase-like ATP-grasp enzyme